MDLYPSVAGLAAGWEHLDVEGELDAFTALRLRRTFDDALAKGFIHFTIDVARLTFVDAAGLAAFVRLHNATVRVGGTVTFIAASPSFRRVCDAVGLTQAFRLPAPSELVEYETA